MWGRMGSAWVMHGACMGDAWPQEAVWPDGTGLHYQGKGRTTVSAGISAVQKDLTWARQNNAR